MLEYVIGRSYVSRNIFVPVVMAGSIEYTELSTFLLLIFVPLLSFYILWKVIPDKTNVVC